MLIAAAALLVCPLARADGDPASDYLLGQATFIPPDDNIPPAYAAQLNAAVREAKARGFTIRVAVIGSRYDMGSVTVLFRQPKRYARFLGEEVALVYKGRLLIVMPNGLAVSRAGTLLPREQSVVGRIPAPGTDGTALASAATRAAIRLAADAGVVVPEPPLASAGRTTGGSSSTRDRIAIAAVALAAALLVSLAVLYRRRRGKT